MEGITSNRGDNSLDSYIARIADARFDGISSVWVDRGSARHVWEVARNAGLQIEGICFPRSIDDVKRVLEFTAELPIRHLVIQADVRSRTPAACADIVEGWLRLAEQVDFPIYLETHRDQMTCDLYFTLEILARYPQLKILADIAHYVVGRGFAHPISHESDAAMQELLDRSWAFHGRVASSQQAQVEISFPSNWKWVEVFRTWWIRGFRSWRQRAGQDESLVFTCEIGPQPYAIADRDGVDRADRWLEALLLRELAQQSWAESGLKKAREDLF